MIAARAVFLDRDGVINRNVYYEASAEWESPRIAGDLELLPGVVGAMGRLQAAGFELFVVSNQPSYAKGKTSLEDLEAVHQTVVRALDAAAVTVRHYYYCWHHPQGIVAGYSRPCDCRKPSPYFLRDAGAVFGIDLARSWMIGDRDTDVECGRRAGTRTVRILPDPADAAAVRADFVATDLAHAAAIILGEADTWR